MKCFKVMCIITVIGIILILCMSLFPSGEVKRTNYSIEKNEGKNYNEQVGTYTILGDLKAGYGIGNSYSNPGTGYTEMYGKIDENMIKTISDSGFSFVRIIADFGKASWVEGSYNDFSFPDYFVKNNGDESTEVKFTIKDEWWSKLDELLNLCQKYNMTLIICPANYITTYDESLGVYSNKGYIHFAAPNYTMNTYVSKYLAELWGQIAEHYTNTPAQNVAYEIVNEPLNRSSTYNGGLYNWQQQYPQKSDADDWSGVSGTWSNYSINEEAGEVLKNYINSSIKVIRNVDSQKLICCPTYAQCSNKVWFDYIYENCVKDNANTCIAFHFYIPQSICGSYAGMTYDSTAKSWNINDVPAEFVEDEMSSSVNGGSESTYDKMLAIKDALNKNYPMIITESSVIMESSRVSLEARQAWASYINENIINKGIPFSIFDNGTLQNDNSLATKAEDYGILDRENLKWKDEKMVQNLVGTDNEPAIEVSNITVKTQPTKTEYIQGEELDLTGGVILVTYTDGKTEEIKMTDSQVIVSGYDKSKIGEQVLTVEYRGKTTQITVVVNQKEEIPIEVKEIRVKNQPKRAEYTQGEELDLTGGVIFVLYTDGKTEEIKMTDSQVTASGYNKNKLGEQIVTIIYKGKTTQITVNVKQKDDNNSGDGNSDNNSENDNANNSENDNTNNSDSGNTNNSNNDNSNSSNNGNTNNSDNDNSNSSNNGNTNNSNNGNTNNSGNGNSNSSGNGSSNNSSSGISNSSENRNTNSSVKNGQTYSANVSNTTSEDKEYPKTGTERKFVFIMIIIISILTGWLYVGYKNCLM